MAQSTIRKALGAVKDQTSISIAKVAGNTASELEVLVVKATSHDEDPADHRYIREIVNLCSTSNGYVSACVITVSKRLSKTRDWIVALKALVVVHRVLIDGNSSFGEEIVYATRKGIRVLDLSGFRDEAHSNSWDHSSFVRSYALYLDEMAENLVLEKRMRGSDDTNFDRRDEFDNVRQRRRQSPWRSMRPESVVDELSQLLRILDRVLACRPTGMAKSSRLVITALDLVVNDSFGLYVEICEGLGYLLDRFKEMEYGDCLRAFDVCANAAKKIDELDEFYTWCKDVGIARSSEYPEAQRITCNLLVTLGGFLKEMSRRPKDYNERRREEKVKSLPAEEPECYMNEIKALPPLENCSPTLQPPSRPIDLVNLREDGVSADEQGNKLALALFSGPPANPNGSWETFSSDKQPEVSSAWQTPAAEAGKPEWELALVETASNLSKQKADMGGGFDPLLLNGMYDHGTIRKHANAEQFGGSSSSVALKGQGKTAAQVLALPAPDGTVKPIGDQDPFAASLTVPPPSYVQIAEMEMKQQLLMQEQLLWQQYGRDGMHGQVGLVKLAGGSAYIGPNPQPIAPQSSAYHYAPF
ncbi:putative clathrin assembly protein At2g25430 [Cucurbita pepo subsp. pepo]|uniref:putative clathrin assembly protein At2g25430 n=1 Tax=Cucurbita pepo subsp. pepo TaxID=3664 RepID=UPI000C9D7B8A|nr:putative clathrin assembly protein At2g25430 [Cucurbita pepo subsp. pepo]